MPESTTLRPCYVFGPWTDRAPEDPIRAVREAPNPSERAEVWLYTKEDDGTPVSSDVAGWYGCFGAMTDSVRLGAPSMTVDWAKAALDILMFKAGHLFAEDVKEVRELARIACAEPVALPASPDALARELYEASPLGPVQTWTWDKAPDVVRRVWRDTAMLVLRKYGQPPATSAQEQGQWRDVAVYNPPTPTRRATDADSPIGDDRAPDRYMASGRETIDEVRDVCRHLFGGATEDQRIRADAVFAAHCLLTAYVYQCRAGHKGPAENDHAKAKWYLQMMRYVLDHSRYSDPRIHRNGFKGYDGSRVTIPPQSFEANTGGRVTTIELHTIAARLGAHGLFYQKPEKYGASRRSHLWGSGCITYTPTVDEARSALRAARASGDRGVITVGGLSVAPCWDQDEFGNGREPCDGIVIGGFGCSTCGRQPQT